MANDTIEQVPLSDRDDEDAALWEDEDGNVWGDHPLPFGIDVHQADLVRPLVLDIRHALKRHHVLFGFFARAVFMNAAGGEKIHSQRYFHQHEHVPPPDGTNLDADTLFVYQSLIQEFLDRGDRMERDYPASYYHISWQARPLLEASAREVERIQGAVLSGKNRNWPDRRDLTTVIQLVRPDFLEHDWSFTRKVPFNYPQQLHQYIERLATVALAELEPKFRDRDAEQAEAARATELQEISKLAAAATGAESHHSADFRAVSWEGMTYTFNPQQAKIVELLWAEFERKPGLGLAEATITEAVASEASRFRVSHVFRSKNKPHPAWKTLIVSPRKGFFCLAMPNHH